ncbi:hypothetical protein CAEBREN_31288 [Caenorhabditis brenneri]|uniref:Uncharacterized protein n=1 Tax=Caenorhabditis brenneri TaxID=135651 RepID=G0MGV7_CAEBE|nr:hypothetical protein CAEBREN_31288 [Caenorhabditis brenneri]
MSFEHRSVVRLSATVQQTLDTFSYRFSLTLFRTLAIICSEVNYQVSNITFQLQMEAGKRRFHQQSLLRLL